MSKPVKEMITRQYAGKFAKVDGVVLIDMRGVQSNANNEMRAMLAGKGIRITMVKNSLARRAIDGTGLSAISPLLEGSCAFVYRDREDLSVVNVARELVAEAKKRDYLQIKGAVMEGVLFNASEVDALSKYPTREEAIAKLVGSILGPAGRLSGAMKGTAGKVAALVKAVEEKGGSVAKLA